jgi:hypothetical protein
VTNGATASGITTFPMAAEGCVVDSSERGQDAIYAAVIVCSAATCCSQLSIWFHLTRVWSTILRS